MRQPRARGTFNGRLGRSLGNTLSLLHHSESDFYVLGATGNVYTVTLSMGTGAPSCTCPDPMTPCKHILFVYVRVLSLSTDDPRIRRRNLRSSEVYTILHRPISEDTYASETLRKRFHELYKVDDEEEEEDDDEYDDDGEQEQGKYINLSAYMDNDDDDADDDDDDEEEEEEDVDEEDGDGDGSGSDRSVNVNGELEQGTYVNLSAQSGVLGHGQVNTNLVLWPQLQEDFVNKINDGKKNNEHKDVKKSSVDISEIEKKLFVMERYASILHGFVFGKPFEEEKDIPISLKNSGSFDVGKERENMLESCDQDKLVRLEMFHRNMLTVVKDKIMKNKIKEMIKECLESSTSVAN